MPTSHSLLASVIVFTVSAVTVTGLRIHVRRSRKLELWLDDVCILVATVLFVLILATPVIMGCVIAGLGDHVPIGKDGKPVPPSAAYNITQFIATAFHVFPIGLTRASFLFMYKRIFRGQLITAAIWVMLFVVFGWAISFFFAQVFACTPVSIGGITQPGTHCIDVTILTYALGLNGALTDFVIMIMPWPGIWKLQMPIKQKAAVIGVFMLGSLSVAASTARCVMFFQQGNIAKARGRSSPEDYTYYLGVDTIWTIAECALGIISASLPTFGRYITAWPSKVNLKALLHALRFRFAPFQPQTSTSSALEFRFARLRGDTRKVSNTCLGVDSEQKPHKNAKLQQQREDATLESKSWDTLETIV